MPVSYHFPDTPEAFCKYVLAWLNECNLKFRWGEHTGVHISRQSRSEKWRRARETGGVGSRGKREWGAGSGQTNKDGAGEGEIQATLEEEAHADSQTSPSHHFSTGSFWSFCFQGLSPSLENRAGLVWKWGWRWKYLCIRSLASQSDVYEGKTVKHSGIFWSVFFRPLPLIANLI